MGPCGGKEKKPDPIPDPIALKKEKINNLQSEINNLHL